MPKIKEPFTVGGTAIGYRGQLNQHAIIVGGEHDDWIRHLLRQADGGLDYNPMSGQS